MCVVLTYCKIVYLEYWIGDMHLLWGLLGELPKFCFGTVWDNSGACLLC